MSGISISSPADVPLKILLVSNPQCPQNPYPLPAPLIFNALFLKNGRLQFGQTTNSSICNNLTFFPNSYSFPDFRLSLSFYPPFVSIGYIIISFVNFVNTFLLTLVTFYDIVIFRREGKHLNEQIKELRKVLNLTLDDFGERLGVTKAAVSRWEKGERSVSEQTIKLICSEFNVNENWLRTGKGEIFRKLTPSEEIENIVRNLLDYSKDSKKNPLYDMIIEMMKDYNELDPDSQAVIKNYCSKVQAGLANNKERLICPSNKLNIDDEVQRYREELELEARQAGKSSAYENTGEINKKQA